jgi:hypothetical protein
MSALTTFIEGKLLPNEKLLAVMDGVYIGLSSVPYRLGDNAKMKYQAAVASTTYRLIIIYTDEGKHFQLIQLLSFNLLVERFISAEGSQPNYFQFPYRAELYASGGQLITIQTAQDATRNQNEKLIEQERQEELSRLITEAYIRLGGRENGDTSTEVAIQAAREEENRRRN